MNCKIIEDKILDYIDGDMSSEEEEIIRKHLENCSECNRKYKEIKSTIDYIKINGGKINRNKDLNLNPNIVKRKPIKKLTRTSVIAIAMSLMLVVTVFATDIFDFMKWWKKSSEIDILAWEKLIENGVGQKLDISVSDKDIKVTAEGVIADELNTIILLEIKDLKGSTRFTPAWDSGGQNPLEIGGDIPRFIEEVPPSVNYNPLYAEDESTIKLMLKAGPMDKDEGEIEIKLNELMSMINEDEESIIRVNGNWNMVIPAKKLKSKTYDVNETIDMDGNKLIIEKIILAPTATNIQYKVETYNKGKRYFIDDISFLVKADGKTYGRSELSYGEYERANFGYSNGEFHIQSLYLEKPKDIDIIVNTYRYTTRGLKKYDIDWDNLPQTIDYQGSQITVEDIKYNDDSTEITIKEDDSRDRKYISSNIYLVGKDVSHVNIDGKDNYFNDNFKIYATYLDYETRDSKGAVKDIEDKFWTDEFHNFVFSWKLSLSEENFRRHDTTQKDHKENLIPDKLYVDGQNYIEFPNIMKNIKLQ